MLPVTPEGIKKAISLVAIACFAALMALWACYHFSFGPIQVEGKPPGMSVPAPEFFEGLSTVTHANHTGLAIWLLGKQLNGHASPWFYPVAIAVKTPIPFLLLCITGILLVFLRNPVWLRKDAWKDREFLKTREVLPLLIASALLAGCLWSNVNIGLRHILPIYPFLAMLAAMGAYWLWKLPKLGGSIALAVLLSWMIVSSVSADPDSLSYFNEIASSNPEYYLIPSDLDWGQDGAKLCDTLRARGVESLDLSYVGSADLSVFGPFPPRRSLILNTAPDAPWVAISLSRLYTNDGFAWLLKETPAAKIGNSILLYHFTDARLAQLQDTLRSSGGLLELQRAENTARTAPTPENYLNLSDAYYKAERFPECVAAAKAALSLKPDYQGAYNNIGAAYNRMLLCDSSIPALEQAVRLAPDNQLSKNNLAWAIEHKRVDDSITESLELAVKLKPTAQNLVDLSVQYYKAMRFRECIEAAGKAIKLQPDFAPAYINIGAGYGGLRNWQKEIEACQQALQLSPSNELAKNNLAYAQRQLQLQQPVAASTH
jgi:tetratricopeptide (TPR) repeat protein